MFITQLDSFLSFSYSGSFFIYLLYSYKNFFKHFSEHLDCFNLDRRNAEMIFVQEVIIGKGRVDMVSRGGRKKVEECRKGMGKEK